MTKSQLEHYLQEHLDRFLSLLQQSVEINSFSENAAGVDEVGDLTCSFFSELGFASESIASANPNYGSHRLLSKQGSSGESLVLVSHLDTVYTAAEEQAHAFGWKRLDEHIYGPGVCDNKGGTLVIFMVLSALRDLAPDLYSHFDWKVFLNSSEEAESSDFAELHGKSCSYSCRCTKRSN